MALATGTMLLVAAASAATNIAGSAMASRAKTKAAKRATSSIQRSAEEAQKKLAPWRVAGEKALAQLETNLEAGPGEFTESPGYQHRVAEGVKALERGASASGALNTGAQKKALLRFGQAEGSREYQSFLDRFYAEQRPLMQLSEGGRGAAGASAGIEERAGQGVARQQGLIGQARAENYKDIAGNIAGFASQATTLGNLGGGGNTEIFSGSNRGPGSLPQSTPTTTKPYDWYND